MRFVIPSSLLLTQLFLSACSEAPSDGGSGGAPSTGGASGGSAQSSGASGGTESGGTQSGGSGGGATESGGNQSGGSGGGATETLNCNDPASLPRTFSAVRQCIIKAGCQSSICHGGEVPLLLIDTWENFPRREDHSPYDLLTETLLNHRVEHCANSPLVDPGRPDNSALVKALARQCDDPEWGMPDGCFETPCVPQEYIDFIAEWIAAGAPMEETP